MAESQDKVVAHIGLGYWGKNILRNLEQLGVLKTAFDQSDEVLSARRREYPDVVFASSTDAIFSDPSVKAVAISTPAATHYKLAKEALLAGKDVFVEKPIALRLRDGLDLLRTAEANGRILMVGHVLQYHPAVQKLKELIKDGALGKVHYIYSNRLNIGKLRTEENILWSFAPHDISIILMLFGEDPIVVNARGGDYVSRNVFDITLTSMEFRNGSRSHIFVSWLNPYKEQKLVVVGSKSMAVFDDMAEQQLVLYPHEIEWKDGKIPVAQKADAKPVPIEKGEPLKTELQHFVHCVRTREKPVTDGLEAVRVLRILHLLEESLKDGSPKEVTATLELGSGSAAVVI